MSLIDGVTIFCATIALVSIVYWWLTTAWLKAWIESESSIPAQPAKDDAVGCDALVPVTFFRPLKRGVSDLGEKLRGFVAEMLEQDQVIFGVNAGAEEALICEELRRTFPSRDLTVVQCERAAASNPKISKLLQMAPIARHEHWIVLDSEFVSEAGWLSQFRREWEQSGKDGFTAGYRFIGAQTLLEALDTFPVITTLWPGLSAVLRGGRVDFMLGAVLAVRRGDLETVGGWQAFGNDLAEDNRLGSALVRTGRSVGISRKVATLSVDPMHWRSYWRHQRRIAVTYRVCNPAGFAGMICTHGMSAAFALILLKPFSFLSWGIFGGTVFIRWCTLTQLHALFGVAASHLLLRMLVAALIETACWGAAWVSRKVWWAGRSWRVRHDGSLCDSKQTDSLVTEVTR